MKILMILRIYLGFEIFAQSSIFSPRDSWNELFVERLMVDLSRNLRPPVRLANFGFLLGNPSTFRELQKCRISWFCGHLTKYIWETSTIYKNSGLGELRELPKVWAWYWSERKLILAGEYQVFVTRNFTEYWDITIDFHLWWILG